MYFTLIEILGEGTELKSFENVEPWLSYQLLMTRQSVVYLVDSQFHPPVWVLQSSGPQSSPQARPAPGTSALGNCNPVKVSNSLPCQCYFAGVIVCMMTLKL